MYTPSFNQATGRNVLIEAMRAYSFAILFAPQAGAEAAASPTATHLPLVVKDSGPHGLLEGHFAKANPQWTAVAGHETLAVFSGPHSYVSPTLYVDPLSVPTWNYIAIHAYGNLQLVEDEAGKNALLEDLIEAHEPPFLERWRGFPVDFRQNMLSGIVGFRIPIARIEGKFKLSQNRAAAERANVQAAHAAGSPDQQALAAWMERLSG
jgi:transcriptional regulator